MNRVRLVCLVCLLALTLPLAAAAQPGPDAGTFAGFWSWLAGLWAEGGCIIDPNGRCAPEAPATNQIEGGCGIDPNGRCAPEAPATSQADAGCILDPSGRCGG